MHALVPGTARAKSLSGRPPMLSALVLVLGFPTGIILMLFAMAALDPTSDRGPRHHPAGKSNGKRN
jgi:hypothetical protein